MGELVYFLEFLGGGFLLGGTPPPPPLVVPSLYFLLLMLVVGDTVITIRTIRTVINCYGLLGTVMDCLYSVDY